MNPDQTGDAPTIQAAMDSATAGDEVVLAAGTYTPTNQGTLLDGVMVRLRAGVSLRGAEETTSAVIDAASGASCVFGRDVGAVRVANLIIARGGGGGFPGLTFAGDCTPTIENCIFQSNGGYGGYASALQCAGAMVRNCQFMDNTSDGVAALACENSVIEGCVFRNNRAGGDGSVISGAVWCRSTRIQGCLFESNQAGDFVSARGGGITGDTVTIESCWFFDNRASASSDRYSAGGGVYVTGVSTITDCVFVGNKAIQGGAIAGAGGTTIRRCTFLGNESLTSDGIGGIALNEGGTVDAVVLAHTRLGHACSGSSAMWTCSNLFGNILGDALCGVDGGGNLSTDPQFCAADPEESRNVGVQEDSPCAPGQHPEGTECGLIGAGPVACGPVNVQPSSWSAVKSMFR